MNTPLKGWSSPSRLPLALALLGVLAACSPSDRSSKEERREAKRAGETRNHTGKAGRIKQLDKNGDGIITTAEFPAGKERRFKRMDTNGDGQLTGAELERTSKAR